MITQWPMHYASLSWNQGLTTRLGFIGTIALPCEVQSLWDQVAQILQPSSSTYGPDFVHEFFYSHASHMGRGCIFTHV